MKTRISVRTNEHNSISMKTVAVDIKRSTSMKISLLIWRGVATVASLALLSIAAMGQGTLKNSGVFRNTGTVTYKEVQNYRNATNGTILNSGTLNTTTAGGGSGNFLNTDGAARAGTVKNYIGGTGSGTIAVATNINNNFAGCAIDNDSTAGFSTIKVAGAVNNTGGTFTTTRGRVVYNGSGAQAVLATTYGTLVTDVGGSKTLAATTTVNDSLRVDNTSTLAISTFQLNLTGATNVAQNSGVFSANAGTVQYDGDRDQTMIAAQYKTLTLSGSTSAHTKTSPGGLSFAASGALTVSANDTLYVSSGNLDLSTNSPSLTNSSAIKVAGNATFQAGITNAGTFYYAGTSTQTIGAVTYANLRLGASGAKTFPNGTVAVTGNYTIDVGAGARDYTTNTNTFQFAGTTGTQTVSNLSETFYVVQFSGAALKSLAGTSFGASRMDLLTGTGQVTNSVTTVTLTNITNVSLTIAAATELVNTATINLNGDIQNDGFLTNSGTIAVY